MNIKWYGHSCFKLENQGGHLTLMIDPFDKKIGLIPPRGNANILLVTHDHYDHNNVQAISGDPFIINTPGEYEVSGVRINGVLSYHDNNQGKDKGENTIYLIELDGIRVCHLGDLGQERLSNTQLEALGMVDVLMIPVGGNFTLNGKQAAKIVEQLEPKIIIPMHYKIPKLSIQLDSADDFLKRMGGNGQKPIDKLNLKAKDLTEKVMEVILMKP